MIIGAIRHGATPVNTLPDAMRVWPCYQEFVDRFDEETMGDPYEAFLLGRFPTPQLRSLAESVREQASRYLGVRDPNDVPLTAEGQNQAQLLGTEIALQEPPDLVLCSHAVRATQTWECMTEKAPHLRHVPLEQNHLLGEQNLGLRAMYPTRATHVTRNPLQARYLRTPDPFEHAYLLGNSVATLRKNMQELLQRLKREENKTILLITHQMTILALMAEVLGLSTEEFQNLRDANPPRNGSISFIDTVHPTMNHYNLPPEEIPRFVEGEILAA